MRTTVTLDPDTAQLIRRRMRERGITFKQAINEAIRAGAIPTDPAATFRTRTFDMGRPRISLDRALQVAAELEDEEVVRKMNAGS